MKSFFAGILVLAVLATAAGLSFAYLDRDSAQGFAARPQIHVEEVTEAGNG